MSRLAEMPCYQIVLDEGETVISTYTVPKDNIAPKKIYMNYSVALEALRQLTGRMESFIPVAYGQAFPYDTVSFEHLLYQKGYATYGWMMIKDEEENEVRIGVGLQLLHLVVPHEG